MVKVIKFVALIVNGLKHAVMRVMTRNAEVKKMKKTKIREGSAAWFLTSGGGIGLLSVAALYGCVCLMVTLANHGVL